MGFARPKSGAWWLLAGLLAIADRSNAADLFLPATGNLLGSVVDSSGVPQMGAAVHLFNKYDRLLAKTFTTSEGKFAFTNLPSDSYAVRVSVPSFLPASRGKIAVKAGEDSVLQIHLATLLSSIEVKYVPPAAIMSEDWKWVLRSSPALRPVTRFLPVTDPKSSSQEARSRTHIFSDTRAVMSLSGGDTGIIDTDYAPVDLGTGFALSTYILGTNQLRVSGTYGMGNGAMPPAMSMAAVYTQAQGASFIAPPEIGFSASQLSLAGGSNFPASNLSGQWGGGPVTQVRAMAISIYQTADPTNNVHIEYGVTGESVDMLQHTSRLSPFARVTADLGSAGKVIAAYSDGARPDELVTHQLPRDTMREEMPSSASENVPGVIARLPQLAYQDKKLRLQRTQSYELGLSKAEGARTYAFSAFYENVTDGRVNVAGDTAALDPGDLLSDGISTTSIYDIGRYARNGYLGSADQRVNDSLDVGVSYGRMGGFTVNGSDTRPSASSSTARQFLGRENHNTAAVDVKAKMPVMGTRILVNYGWVDGNAVVPRHVFVTQNTTAQPGFNILVQQPLPQICNMGGHFELTADLYNLLAQGYLPVNSGDGHRLLVVQAPRAIRGGLKFVF